MRRRHNKRNPIPRRTRSRIPRKLNPQAMVINRMRNNKTRQAMKLRYIYTLLTLILVLYFVPANAQTKKSTKKPATKTTDKKTTKPAPAKKSEAKNLGDAATKAPAAKSAAADTSKNQNALTEQIVITTAYKPLLADAVKIRRNPDLEDVTPYKAPLSYKPYD